MTDPKAQDWKERFYENNTTEEFSTFHKLSDEHCAAWDEGMECCLEKEWIKNFIAQEIANAEEKAKQEGGREVIEELEKKIKEMHRTSESRSAELETSQGGYEYGLEDVLTALSKFTP